MMEISLFIHIIFGIICLITGLLAIGFKKEKGKHTLTGEIYHASYLMIFITSVLMAIANWNESAYLFYIAIFSYGLAIFGYLSGKIKGKNWLMRHTIGMLGSYIGVITAVLVVNQPNIPVLQDLPTLIIWFLPTIIGSPLITIVQFKLKAKPINNVSSN